MCTLLLAAAGGAGPEPVTTAVEIERTAIDVGLDGLGLERRLVAHDQVRATWSGNLGPAAR